MKLAIMKEILQQMSQTTRLNLLIGNIKKSETTFSKYKNSANFICFN